MSATPEAVSPATAQWLERVEQVVAEVGAPKDDSLEERRRVSTLIADILAMEFTRPVPAGVEVIDTVLPISGGLSARIFRPSTGLTASTGTELLPTQLYLHGGGFLYGSVKEQWGVRLLAERARFAGIQIISLGYRLAPEHPYPAAQTDVLNALHLLVTEAERYRVDPTRLGVGGNSAGGSIAAGAVLRLRDAQRQAGSQTGGARQTSPAPDVIGGRIADQTDAQRGAVGQAALTHADDQGEARGEGGDTAVVHQLLEVTPADFDLNEPETRALIERFGESGLDELLDLYTVNGSQSDKYLEPGLAEDLNGMPESLIMVAEFDPARISATLYADRLAEAGVESSVHLGAGMVHGSVGVTAIDPEARRWQQRVIEELARVYRTGVTDTHVPDTNGPGSNGPGSLGENGALESRTTPSITTSITTQENHGSNR